jgi:hypothetical protein
MNLQRWIVEFEDATDSSGRSLFTRNTKKVAIEQLKKVKHVSDPVGVPMYTKIPPGPRSLHNLPKWKSNRPESLLEKFHELLAHLANTGTNPALADAITLRGTAEHNVRCRWKMFVNNKKLQGQKLDIPCHFEDTPRYMDHSMLDLLNRRAVELKLTPVFDNVTPIHNHNGEKFLSAYYLEQQERNKSVGQDSKTSMCLCPLCKAYLAIGDKGSIEIGQELPLSDSPRPDGQIDAQMAIICQPVVPQANKKSAPWLVPLSPALFTNSTFGVQPSGWLVYPQPMAQVIPYSKPPLCCADFALYQHKKLVGLSIFGRPPHSRVCVRRRK